MPQSETQAGCSADGMEPFVLRVIGDSMSPEFEDGHIIVVDPGYPLLSGCYAVVVNHEEALFGLYRNDESGCRIEYLNPMNEPVVLDANFQVKGIITQRNGRRRKDTKYYSYPLSEG